MAEVIASGFFAFRPRKMRMPELSSPKIQIRILLYTLLLIYAYAV